MLTLADGDPRSDGGSAPAAHLAAKRLRAATYCLVAGGAVIAIVLAVASGVRATAEDAGALACLIGLLLLTSALLSRRGLRPRIGDIVGTLGVSWLGGFIGASIALSGLRLKFPVADETLLAADRAMGIDGVAIVEALVRQGQWIFTLMAPAYAWTIPLVGLSMVALAVTGNRLEAWRAAFCFNGALLSSCLLAMFVPAKGLGLWFSQGLVKHLPEGAARYAFPRFDQFYYGADPQLGVSAVEGVVTFPSFHLAMGLIVLAMWRNNGWTLALAAAWFAVMLVSTLPYGGHYAVDLVGGAVVWALWYALARGLERSAVPQLAPAAIPAPSASVRPSRSASS